MHMATSPGRRMSMARRYASKPRNFRSGGTSILSGNFSLSNLIERSIFSSSRSAVAYSLIGPLFGTRRASPTAPVPRPPQPSRARRIVWSWAANARAGSPPSTAVPAASELLRLRNSRRFRSDVSVCCVMLISSITDDVVRFLPPQHTPPPS